VIAWVRKQRPGTPSGWPLLVRCVRCAACCGVGAGEWPHHGGAGGALYDFSTLALPQCPWLLIQGEADEVVPVETVRDWLSGMAPRPQTLFLRASGISSTGIWQTSSQRCATSSHNICCRSGLMAAIKK